MNRISKCDCCVFILSILKMDNNNNQGHDLFIVWNFFRYKIQRWYDSIEMIRKSTLNHSKWVFFYSIKAKSCSFYFVNILWHIQFILSIINFFFQTKKIRIKTWRKSSILNLVVFPKRNIRPQAGAIRIGTESVDEILCCLKKHRTAAARDAKPVERSLSLLFSHFSMTNLHAHESKQMNCIALKSNRWKLILSLSLIWQHYNW